jgi:hypothetical protein
MKRRPEARLAVIANHKLRLEHRGPTPEELVLLGVYFGNAGVLLKEPNVRVYRVLHELPQLVSLQQEAGEDLRKGVLDAVCCLVPAVAICDTEAAVQGKVSEGFLAHKLLAMLLKLACTC